MPKEFEISNPSLNSECEPAERMHQHNTHISVINDRIVENHTEKIVRFTATIAIILDDIHNTGLEFLLSYMQYALNFSNYFHYFTAQLYLTHKYILFKLLI